MIWYPDPHLLMYIKCVLNFISLLIGEVKLTVHPGSPISPDIPLLPGVPGGPGSPGGPRGPGGPGWPRLPLGPDSPLSPWLKIQIINYLKIFDQGSLADDVEIILL